MYYIIALIISLLLCKLTEKQSFKIGLRTRGRGVVYWKIILSFLPLLFLAAFRWDLGVDTIYGKGHYSSGYKLAAAGKNTINYAIGFFKFFEFFAKHHIPLFWCYFVITILYFFAVFYLIKKLNLNLFWSIVTFFAIDLYLFSFSAVRQALAFVFVFIALAVLFQNNKRRYLYTVALLVIATLIHYTSAVYFVLVFVEIVNRKKNFSGIKRKTVVRLLIAGVVSSPVLYYMARRVLSSTAYAIILVDTDFTPSYLIFSGVLVWTGYRYWKGIVAQNPRHSLLVISILALFIITIISSAIFHMDRVFHLLCPIFLIYIPVLWNAIDNKIERFLIFLIIVLMMAFLIRNYFIPGTLSYEAVGTYQSVFEDWDYYTNLGTY